MPTIPFYDPPSGLAQDTSPGAGAGVQYDSHNLTDRASSAVGRYLSREVAPTSIEQSMAARRERSSRVSSHASPRTIYGREDSRGITHASIDQYLLNSRVSAFIDWSTPAQDPLNHQVSTNRETSTHGALPGPSRAEGFISSTSTPTDNAEPSGASAMEPAEQQVPTHDDCPVCLENEGIGVFLECCAPPSWIHTNCLVNHLDHRLREQQRAEAEDRGEGLQCPNSAGSDSHIIPVASIVRLLPAEQGEMIERVHDFFLAPILQNAQQYTAENLPAFIPKFTSCPRCQKPGFANVGSEYTSQFIRCDGFKIDGTNCQYAYCALCSGDVHAGISCNEAERLADNYEANQIRGKIRLYRDALSDDHQFRPCPKCDGLIEKIDGCNLIRRTGEHAAHNSRNDQGNCDHNICFECLDTWRIGPGHNFFICDNNGNRRRVYEQRIAELNRELQVLIGSSEDTEESLLHSVGASIRIQLSSSYKFLRDIFHGYS